MTYRRVEISRKGGPEVLQMVTINNLPEPGPGEVRIRILVTSASFTDTLVRKGKYPGVRKKYPLCPGYDLVGIADKSGEGVKDIKEGQMLAAMPVIGAYSEYICLPVEKLVPVPENLDPVEAVSLVLTYVTAWQMLHHIAEVKKNHSILIHGSGGAVGTALMQLGKRMNLTMYGTASRSKHELLREWGVIPIDYRKEDFEQRVMDETNEGLDAVFDAIGGDNFNHSFKCLKKSGTLVAYGFYNAGMGKEGNVVWDFLKVLAWNLLPNGRNARFYSIGYNKWFRDDLRQLFLLLKEGSIKPVIDRVLPLEEASKAHELIEQAAVKGKIILRVSGPQFPPFP